jgi:hypothetical protein
VLSSTQAAGFAFCPYGYIFQLQCVLDVRACEDDNNRSLDCLERLIRKHSPVAIRPTGSWQRLEISDRTQP